ncbi:hypothetical protein [Marinibacterium sp. SX1]|uniref:hypothetical protein n=1 Tax=Marinibacterium sp. SX1 TaxID=3388424 RepID=UPI003D183F6E
MTGLQEIELPPGERGRIRVFSLSMSEDEARHLELGRALGKYPDDPSRVEVFPVSNLDGLGLAGYLVEGCGVPEAQVAPDRARLDALGGHVLLLFSRAYAEGGVTLEPEPALTLIGTYDEDRPAARPGPLIETESAKPFTGKPRLSPRDNRAASRRAGAIFFGLVMLLLLVVVILVL